MKKSVLILFMITIWLSANDTLYSKYQKSFEEQDYLSAKNYLIQDIDKTIKTNNNIEKLQKLYANLANIYKMKNEFYKALEYYKLSLKLERSKKTPSKKEKLIYLIALVNQKMMKITSKYVFLFIFILISIFSISAFELNGTIKNIEGVALNNALINITIRIKSFFSL